MKKLLGRFLGFSIVIAAVSAVLAPALSGQELRLDVGDKLEFTVPQRQELGRTLIINDRGEVYIPVIGNIVIQGMTMEEAETAILRKLQELYPGVQRIILTLLGGELRRLVYVHGQVVNAGKYEFTETPNVWEAIREAGGATPEASLENVVIIRAEGKEKRTSLVNLQQSIDSGNFTNLPTLKPGDTVIVPQRSVRYGGSSAVRVVGSVINPAPYMLSGSKTLVDALLAAGGPDENANLGKVRIIRMLPEGGTKTLEVDFKRYINSGDERCNPLILPGDTVYLSRRSNYLSVILTDPRFLLGLVTAGATITALLLRG